MTPAVKSPGSVAFCILNNHHMLPDAFFWSYLRMKKPRTSFAVKGDTSVKASTFDDAAYKGLALGAEWLFFMDVDQTFHPDTIPRLLATADESDDPYEKRDREGHGPASADLDHPPAIGACHFLSCLISAVSVMRGLS